MGKNVCVVVLGDIGRSPRMQYHAVSLAENGHKVDIVGYRGATPIDKLTAQPQVSFHYLNEFPKVPLPRSINLAFKAVWQLLSCLFVFLIIRRADYILVQNPPAVPTLCACYIYKVFSRAKLVIDWHNYAYTIMALGVGQQHVLVKLSRRNEKFFGKRADYNLCVTAEMRLDLEGSWGIHAQTLYDRPSDLFRPITLQEKHELFKKLQAEYEEILPENVNTADTLFTSELDDKEVVLRKDRPGLLVSSTSWTEDEDFSVLLYALQEYENHIENGNKYELPTLICVITGNGPMKEHYKKLVNEAGWKHVKVITPWLEAKDYPLMLASADLGVSLHISSSGLDLPMKVVDMFGCQLPVCAHNFKCLHELVQHNETGFVFNTSEELAEQLIAWFKEYPDNPQQREMEELIKKNLVKFRELGWRENWQTIASPIFA